MNFKVLYGAGLLSLSQLSSAAINWTNPVEISSVRALESGGFMIQTSNAVDQTCPGSGKQFYVVANENHMTVEGLKSLLSVSLISITTDRKLNILYDNASINCYVRNLEITK